MMLQVAGVLAGCLVAAVVAGRWYGRTRWSRWTRRADDTDALRTSALTPGLAGLVHQTRVLRLLLETPMRRFGSRTFGATPWRRRERCDEYDLEVGNCRRAVWDWLRFLDGMSSEDLDVLRCLGLSPVPMRRVLFQRGVFDRTDDVWEEVLFPSRPDLRLVSTELRQAALDLRHFESALLSYRAEPYR